jgi:hypothetical protein
MASPLQTITLSAPAFAGINTQESPTDIDHTYAIQADNCVIDKFGRIGARKGFAQIEANTIDVTAITEFVYPDGDTRKVYAGGLKIFTEGGVNITPTGAIIVSDDWKIVELNNMLYLSAMGNDNLVIYASGTNLVCTKMTSHSTASGSIASCNEILAAYGRLWAANFDANTSIVYWSDLLIGCAWDTGSSGAIDLSKVWADGSDDIVAISDHNDYLVVFGTRQILLYSGAKEPETMQITDKIVGTGCIARDSVQRIGNDILFLSSSGVKSLNRTIQEKSVPLRDISLNVRDDMIDTIALQTTPIKSVYSEQYGFYLLQFDKKAYVFNLSGALPNGSFRVTTWSGGILASSWYQTKRKSILLGKRGVFGYGGYLDDASPTETGQPYTMKFYTGYLNFDNNFSLKFLKKVSVLTIGGQGEQVIVKWAYDYSTLFQSQRYVIPSRKVDEWGVDEWGLSVWDTGVETYRQSINANGNGVVTQVGVEIKIEGNPASVQRLDVYATMGAIR